MLPNQSTLANKPKYGKYQQNRLQLQRTDTKINVSVGKLGDFRKRYIFAGYHHRQVIEFEAKNRDGTLLAPTISEDDVFVAPSATIAGNVSIYQHSSIWYNCVLKGRCYMSLLPLTRGR
jgi:hypothetical protein